MACTAGARFSIIPKLAGGGALVVSPINIACNQFHIELRARAFKRLSQEEVAVGDVGILKQQLLELHVQGLQEPRHELGKVARQLRCPGAIVSNAL